MPRDSPMGFAELSATSNFTFLTGASHAEEYADRAALLGPHRHSPSPMKTPSQASSAPIPG